MSQTRSRCFAFPRLQSTPHTFSCPPPPGPPVPPPLYYRSALSRNCTPGPELAAPTPSQNHPPAPRPRYPPTPNIRPGPCGWTLPTTQDVPQREDAASGELKTRFPGGVAKQADPQTRVRGPLCSRPTLRF